ncbi:MAG TPA: hypothetical protein VG406_19065 [Isosphaeraceae bacterium]|jgi:hypothetical protein|nr:hypothetical protein [Isosphaeraceae bacterium]
MRRYQTEVFIPADRSLSLQLPANVPAGRAVVTILVVEPEAAEAGGNEGELDRQDIEWWEEFEGVSEPDEIDAERDPDLDALADVSPPPRPGPG